MGSGIFRALAACGAAVLVASSVAAHHFVPQESDKTVRIAGTVTKFQMINPHSRLFLEVRDASGSVTVWEIELGSIGALTSRGWTRDLVKPGDVVTVEAILWKGRANAAVARDIQVPDGRRLFAGSHAGDYPLRR
ncbi:MAG: hypothetical protein HYU37_15085 [Acidobacteria bacterium]|nr:hypothetical protein [Acidobacteriota bacterium]